MKKKVTVIFTCFNRKEKSVECVKSLINGNKNIDFDFIVVDDNSSDGTAEALRSLSTNNIEIIKGTGNLYWAGGMREGIKTLFLRAPSDNDFCLLANDDVEFYDKSIENLIERLDGRTDYVVVGATCNAKGAFTYGMKAKSPWLKQSVMENIHPSKAEIVGVGFNANCVLMHNQTLKKAGNIDEAYTHCLGDIDLGYRMTKMGIKLISSENYVGRCEGNANKGTWKDTSLTRRQRVKLKESPTGDPIKVWWHFLTKYYGFPKAVIVIIRPYFRILLQR